MRKFISLKYLIEYYLPALFFIVCFVWRFLFITDRDICLDEPFTIYFAQKSLYDIIMLTVNGEPNPPLFMILTHFWIYLSGGNISPEYLRILPLIFSSLTVVVLYRTALKIGDVFSALLTSSLFLFSTLTFFFSLEVRTYSLLSFFTSVVLYQYFTLVKDQKNKSAIFFIIAANIGLALSHYFGWFVIAIESLFLIFNFSQKQLVKKTTFIFTATFILCSPLIFLLIKQFLFSSKGTWVTPPSGGEYLYYIIYFFNDWRTFDYIKYILLLAALFSIGKSIKAKHFEWSEIKDVIMLLLCFIVPYFTMYFVSFKIPMFISRYILFNTIPLYLFVGVAIGKLFDRMWFLKILALLFICISAFEHLSINPKDFYYREVKSAVNYSLKFKTPDALIFIHPNWLKLEYTYYADKALFNNISNQDSALNAARIFPLDNLNDAIDTIKNYRSFNTIIFYYGRNLPSDTINNSILAANHFRLSDSSFFPQCQNVSVYRKEKF